MHTCRVCLAAKPPADFYKGYRICKPCKILRVRQASKRSVGAYVRHLYSQCRMRHKRDGYEGEFLTWEQFEGCFARHEGRCALSGMAFDVAQSHLSPSPDRIDNRRGYVCGNVQFVTWQVNNMRRDMTVPGFVALCAAIAAH